MSAQEDHISPEEKLLKVIQGGGKTEARAANTPEEKPATGKTAASAEMRIPPVVRPRVARPAASQEAASPKVKLRAVEPQKIEARATPAKGPAKAPDVKAPDVKVPDVKVPVEKPKLMPVERVEAPRIAPAGGSRLIGVGGPVVAPKKRQRVSLGIGALNRLLVAAAVLVILLTGWEIWTAAAQNSRTDGSPGPIAGLGPETSRAPDAGTPEPAASPPGGEPGLVPLDNVLKIFEQKPILGAPPEIGPSPTNTLPIVQAGWEAYAKANLKLKGLSSVMSSTGQGQGEMEAIVEDKKTGRMSYLKTGQEMPVDKQIVKIESIGADEVILSDGVRRVQVK